MPTRSGLDHHEIHPEWFVCAYCYSGTPNNMVCRREGMIRKRVSVRVDDGVNDFQELEEWTRVWTEPHCNRCNREIRGIKLYFGVPKRYKYPA